MLRTPRLALWTGALMVAPLFAPAAAQNDSGVPSRTGIVVSASAPASDIGAAILRQGGNAVDAAVGTAFALAVTLPGAGNIGGGGFMLIRLRSGSTRFVDYREAAPARAAPPMYLRGDGSIDHDRSTVGYLAVGVPGTVRGLALAEKKYGRLRWSQVLAPAATLAATGFSISEAMARDLNWAVDHRFARFPSSLAVYRKPDGGPWAAGDTLKLPDLARALRDIAREGPEVFYRGWIADSIARQMAAHGGLVTKEDLAAYGARERAPVRGRFRGYEIVSAPPPSSGGTVLIEMLNILEHYDLKTAGRYSAATQHLTIEAMRRAYADRARWLGDPDFVPQPIARLTSEAYGDSLARSIDLARATASAALSPDLACPPAEPPHTTHFSVVDRDGNAVANTYTINDWYGSGVVVQGAGFLLNNEMDDFNKHEGCTGPDGEIGTAPNAIASGKRMLSSMTPTIVTHNGHLRLVTGTPGGRTIPNTVLAVVLNVIEFGMPARQAVLGPRIHHQWMPDTVLAEQDAMSDSVLAALQAMGHAIRRLNGPGRFGDAHTIVIDDTGVAWGANDASADSKASPPD
jgi:gamma-glutamyltranspeptidase / glutathione hydrolase